MSSFAVRPYHPGDLDAVYDICLKTGDSGEDASHLYADPLLLGHLYVAPYVILEPELAFVLEDKAGVCGYVVGALDSDHFSEKLQLEWFPDLRLRYPQPSGPSDAWTKDERIIQQFYDPPQPFEDTLRPYPSHLHIDLLPRAQGKGQGKRIMMVFLDNLRAKGSPGVHLGVGTRNTRAQGYYRAMGFKELLNKPFGIYFGMKL